MGALRAVFGLLLMAGVVCFAIYAASGQLVWRRRGLLILRWTIGGAFAFFAVLIVSDLVNLR
ncbi:MAG: hypothetical protein KGM91_22730 [Burkholderiales bacterium]|nr:hypothetical protein [Burkholderiales bacterium]MDE2398261.1 hypothetical protein [Burkholderiales bacterium]